MGWARLARGFPGPEAAFQLATWTASGGLPAAVGVVVRARE